MANKLSESLRQKISFFLPNLLRFIIRKRKENFPFGYILVLIMLHYLPRFQNIPPISDCVDEITREKPIEFEQFVKDY